MPDNLYLAWWNLENLFDVGPHPGHDEPSPQLSPGLTPRPPLRRAERGSGFGNEASSRRGSRSQRRLSPLLPPGEGAGG
jgi:hypothetical protein